MAGLRERFRRFFRGLRLGRVPDTIEVPPPAAMSPAQATQSPPPQNLGVTDEITRTRASATPEVGPISQCDDTCIIVNETSRRRHKEPETDAPDISHPVKKSLAIFEDSSQADHYSSPEEPKLEATETPAPISRRRRVFETISRATPGLDIVASVAGSIPILGSTLEGTLDALVKLMRHIELHYQNVDEVQDLKEEIDVLNDILCTAPDDSRAVRRLVTQLNSAEARLEEVVSTRRSEADITALISSCSRRIAAATRNFYAESALEQRAMLVFLVEERKKDGSNIEVMRELVAAMLGDDGMRMLRNPLLKGIIIVDPFGNEHTFAKLPAEPEFVAKEIQRQYTHEEALFKIFEDYIGLHPSLYEMTLDDGKEIHPLSPRQLSVLDPGTKIVLSLVRVVTVQENGGLVSRVRCALCDKWIVLSAHDRQRKRYVACRFCKRRVHATFDNAVAIVVYGWQPQAQGSEPPERCDAWVNADVMGGRRMEERECPLRNIIVKLAKYPSVVRLPPLKPTMVVQNFHYQTAFTSTDELLLPCAEFLRICSLRIMNIFDTKDIPADYDEDWTASTLHSFSQGVLEAYGTDLRRTNHVFCKTFRYATAVGEPQDSHRNSESATAASDDDGKTGWPHEHFPGVERLYIWKLWDIRHLSIEHSRKILESKQVTLNGDLGFATRDSLGTRRETLYRRGSTEKNLIFPYAYEVYIHEATLVFIHPPETATLQNSCPAVNRLCIIPPSNPC